MFAVESKVFSMWRLCLASTVKSLWPGYHPQCYNNRKCMLLAGLAEKTQVYAEATHWQNTKGGDKLSVIAALYILKKIVNR